MFSERPQFCSPFNKRASWNQLMEQRISILTWSSERAQSNPTSPKHSLTGIQEIWQRNNFPSEWGLGTPWLALGYRKSHAGTEDRMSSADSEQGIGVWEYTQLIKHRIWTLPKYSSSQNLQPWFPPGITCWTPETLLISQTRIWCFLLFQELNCEDNELCSSREQIQSTSLLDSFRKLHFSCHPFRGTT